MEFVLKMLNLQFMLFALIIIGILSHKMKIITCQNRKAFSDLLINIVLPCNIVNSFLSKIEVSIAFFHNCLLAIPLSSCIQIFATAISKVLFPVLKKMKKILCLME